MGRHLPHRPETTSAPKWHRVWVAYGDLWSASMLVTIPRSPRVAEVAVNNTVIPQVETLKLLGVTIQSDLKWNSLVESIISKANYRKYFVLVLKLPGVGQQHLVKAYCTVIRPVLKYIAYVRHIALTEVQAKQLRRSGSRSCAPVCRRTVTVRHC